MLNLARKPKPEDYLAFAWRRKWWILVPFVVVSGLGLGVVFHLPKLYRSTTLIMLVPQRVPTEYIRPTVTTTVEERLQSIATQVLSRTNLQTIIEEFNLYPKMTASSSKEEVLDFMRSNIEIEMRRGQKGGPRRETVDAFELSFSHSDPKTAMLVTNRLASFFIEQNLKLREQQAESTASFLADQLKKVEADLAAREQEIAQFKVKHMGVLPEQVSANLGMLQQLQMQYQRLNDSIRSAEDRKVLYVNQLAELKRFSASTRAEQAGLQEETPAGPGQPSTLEQLEASLAQLRAKYTEKHPDVVALKKRVEEARQAASAQPEGSGGGQAQSRPRRPGVARGGLDQTETMIANVQAQLAATESEIRQLRAEELKLKARIREYEERIETAPKIEQMMTDLTRGYDNTRKLYESLLAKKLEAEQAKAMEQRQQGEQFRILDPAQMPTKPWKPDMRKMIILCLVAGLGAGLGLALLVDYRDRSFKDPEDLEAFTGLKVVAVLPRIDIKEEASSGKRKARAG